MSSAPRVLRRFSSFNASSSRLIYALGLRRSVSSLPRFVSSLLPLAHRVLAFLLQRAGSSTLQLSSLTLRLLTSTLRLFYVPPSLPPLSTKLYLSIYAPSLPLHADLRAPASTSATTNHSPCVRELRFVLAPRSWCAFWV